MLYNDLAKIINDKLYRKYGLCRWKLSLINNCIGNRCSNDWEISIYLKDKTIPIVSSDNNIIKLINRIR